MRTLQQMLVQAPQRKVYEAVARIELWPRLLAHYRWVRILKHGRKERQVEMAASRDGFPCKWRALQVLHPGNEVYYRHTEAFWTRGMEVWWRFKKVRGGTEVTLSHDMPRASNPLVEAFRQHVVGRLFVENIAAKTMAGLKAHLEKP